MPAHTHTRIACETCETCETCERTARRLTHPLLTRAPLAVCASPAVGEFTLYSAFGGIFAPQDRDLESLANPYDSKLGRRPRPEEYDWRAKVKGGAWTLKQVDKSSKINPRDTSTW